jgi:hypothetical protein
MVLEHLQESSENSLLKFDFEITLKKVDLLTFFIGPHQYLAP